MTSSVVSLRVRVVGCLGGAPNSGAYKQKIIALVAVLANHVLGGLTIRGRDPRAVPADARRARAGGRYALGENGMPEAFTETCRALVDGA